MKKVIVILMMLMFCSVVVEAKIILKTNTATVIYCGPFTDFSDGVTPETGMTVTNITCELYKYTVDGSVPTRTALTLSASAGDNDMVHITSDVAGMYSLELTAANINFLGGARITFTDPDVMCGIWEDIEVVSANVYDSILSTDLLQVDVEQVDGVAAAATTMETFFDVATAADNMHDFFANATAYGKFDDAYDGTKISVADSYSDAITLAEIEGEAVDALESFDLDHLLSVTTGVSANADLEAFVSSGTVMAHVLGIGADVTTFKPTEDSLEAQGTLLATIETDTEMWDTTGEARTMLTGTAMPIAPAPHFTTIAAYTSNTSFTLTAGHPNNSGCVGHKLMVVDQSDATQFAVGTISAYTTAANTITLEADPLAAFTFANGDLIYILQGSSLSTIDLDAVGDAVRTEPVTTSETAFTAGWLWREIYEALGLMR